MSALSSDLVDYLALRRGLGYNLAEVGRVLERFVDHQDGLHAETITVASALSWATDTGRGGGVGRRLEAIRGFARYMQALDPRHEVPPAGLIPIRSRRALPHLYSNDEIATLVATAHCLAPPLRAATTETVIGLLAVTGMRIGEVLALNDADVDFQAGVITVWLGKFNRARYVPIAATTIAALEVYRNIRRRFVPRKSGPALFVSPRGARLNYQPFRRSFVQVVDIAGVRAANGQRPRIHDFRHSFAVRTLLDWYRQGGDVQALLPRLSTYLGHVNPASTYWYLTGTPELLALAAQRVERIQGGTS